MKSIIAVLSLMVVGCATTQSGQQFNQVHQMCEQSVPYPQLGQCLDYSLSQSMPNWKQDKHSGYVAAYIAWLNAAGERVVSGQASESEMRYGAAQLLNRMRYEAKQADQAATSSRMAMFFSGLALMNAGQGYASSAPQTTTLWSPGNRPISCTESLGVISCY
jgi:hypothetical protein